MKDKINIAELLKDCPRGMELDCYLFNGLEFDHIDTYNENYPIVCRAKDSTGEYYTHTFTKYGWYNSSYDYSKCVIFPKGKTNWEGFQRPFKDGDILVYKHKSNNVKYTFIYKRRMNMHYLLQYCGWFQNKLYLSEQFNAKERMPWYENDDIKFATEEEKQEFFKAIKDNGYKWNAETKTLEKLVEPKFKVGDKIVKKNSVCVPILITKVSDEFYYSNTESSVGVLSISEQDNYELVPDKFDINTLVPFESRVLIRDNVKEKWHPGIWGYYDNDTDSTYPYKLIGVITRYCIPYEGNEHLLGTTNDCDDYFKTWK